MNAPHGQGLLDSAATAAAMDTSDPRGGTRAPAIHHRRIVAFIKAPTPGQVKTRIAAALDPDAAAAIYRVLIDRTLATLAPFQDVELRFTPPDAEPQIQTWLRPGWRTASQGEGDLGTRMGRAVSEAHADGATRIVLVGSDCPGMTPSDIEDALAALDQNDVVLGPSVDGGYWLVALRRPEPGIFQAIPWSTSQVFTTTLERARLAGLRVRVLRELRDIDTLEDWRAFLRPAPRR